MRTRIDRSRWSTVLLACIALAPEGGAQGGSLVEGRFYAQSASNGLEVVDFDGDLVPDVLSTNVPYVRFGLGDGSLSSARDFPDGTAFATAADANVDGHLDVVTLRYNTIRVYFGDGQGEFSAGPSSLVPFTLFRAAVGDLNGDGIPDLFALSRAFLGQGDGTFVTGPTSALPPSSLVRLDDLDGDGALDAVGLDNGISGQHSVFSASGDGTGFFTLSFELDVPTYARTFRLADLDGDGESDLAGVSGAQGPGIDSVWVHRGLGDGTFGPALVLPVAPDPYDLAIGDADGDGELDLVATSLGWYPARAGTVSVLRGDGQGSFAPVIETATGMRGERLALGDWDGDTRADVLLSRTNITGANGLTILPGRGDGRFRALLPVDTGDWGRSVAIGDVTGDAKPDLVSAMPDSSAIAVYENIGQGRFGAEQAIAVPGIPFRVRLGDLDQDGHLDAVAAIRVGSSMGEIAVLLADGLGGFGSPATYDNGDGSLDLALGDVDGDGVLDVVASDAGQVRVHLGVGDGTLLPFAAFALPIDGWQIALGDLNEDGLQDVLGSDPQTDQVVVALSVGGTLGGSRTYPVSAGLTSLAVADLDGDGHLDVGATSDDPGRVTVLAGDGRGGLAEVSRWPVSGQFPDQLLASDLDGDGHTDLLCRTYGSFSWLRGLGAGSFARAQEVATPQGVSDLQAGQLVGGGHREIALSVYGAPELWVWHTP